MPIRNREFESPGTGTQYCDCSELKSDNIPPVDISPKGEFNYILFALHCPHTLKKPTILVRGHNRHKNFINLYEEVMKKVKPPCEHKVLGGGKIRHDAVKKTLHIFGTSDVYEKADHSLTATLIKASSIYPEYTITVDNNKK